MKFILKKAILAVITLAMIESFLSKSAEAVDHTGHEMQHGFVLSADDRHASHLVANGRHSRQVSIIGALKVLDSQEAIAYEERKQHNDSSKESYFLFQAQNLDLPSLKGGDILSGHIVESRLGHYDAKNIIVRSAKFYVQQVPVNILNPFFLGKLNEL